MKRFTDTEKWRDAWYRQLSPKMKCAWQYILDTCDNAGVWKIDFAGMSFNIGEEVLEIEFYDHFADRIKIIDDKKIWIKKFIEFQSGRLKVGNKPQEQIIVLLEKYGLIEEYKKNSKSGDFVLRVSDTLQDKDKDKDKEKDKEKEKEIETAFRAVKEFTNWPKERLGVRQLVEKCEAVKIDWKVMFKKFKELHTNDKKYMELPFSPSILASGWFDSVYNLVAREKKHECCGAPMLKEFNHFICAKCGKKLDG